MKNLKKIFSVILTIAMVCSLSVAAFAADAGDPFETYYTVKAAASSNSIAAGEDVTISVYISLTESPEENIYFTKSIAAPWGIELTYDNSVFSYKSHSTTYALTETGNGGDKGTKFKYEAKMNEDITVSPATAIFSVVFTANSGLTEAALANEFVIESLSVTDAIGNGADIGCDDGNYEYVSANVDVTVGGGEEVFEAKVEGTATEDVVALFAKNTTGAELAAGTYGIHFGGVDFAAGVDANKDAVACPKDGKFVVKFLYKDGSKIAKGIYEFWAYYDNGNEVSTKQTVEIK